MKKLFTLTLSLILVSVFTSCTKTGPAGPAGANGAPGNANVTATIFTTTNSSWSVSSNLQIAVFNVPAITQAVLDKGTVQLFLGDGTNQYWQALPCSIQGSEYNFTTTPGKIEIIVSDHNGTDPGNPGGEQFKLVVIPGQ